MHEVVVLDIVGIEFILLPVATHFSGGSGIALDKGKRIGGIGNHTSFQRIVVRGSAVGPEGDLNIVGLHGDHGRSNHCSSTAAGDIEAACTVKVSAVDIRIAIVGHGLVPAVGEVTSVPTLETLDEGHFNLAAGGTALTQGAEEGVVAAERTHAEQIERAGGQVFHGVLQVGDRIGHLRHGVAIGVVFHHPAALGGTGSPLECHRILGNSRDHCRRSGAVGSRAVAEEADVGHDICLATIQGRSVTRGSGVLGRHGASAVTIPIDGIFSGSSMSTPIETIPTASVVQHGNHQVAGAVPGEGGIEHQVLPTGGRDIYCAVVDKREVLDGDIIVGVDTALGGVGHIDLDGTSGIASRSRSGAEGYTVDLTLDLQLTGSVEVLAISIVVAAVERGISRGSITLDFTTHGSLEVAVARGGDIGAASGLEVHTVAVALGEAGQEEVVALHEGAVPTLQGVGGSVGNIGYGDVGTGGLAAFLGVVVPLENNRGGGDIAHAVGTHKIAVLLGGEGAAGAPVGGVPVADGGHPSIVGLVALQTRQGSDIILEILVDNGGIVDVVLGATHHIDMVGTADVFPGEGGALISGGGHHRVHRAAAVAGELHTEVVNVARITR